MIRLLIVFLLIAGPACATESSYYPRSRWMPNPTTDIAPGDVTAPAAPSSVIVTPQGRGLAITIVGAAEPSDFAYYEIHKGLSAGAMAFFSRGRTTQVNDAAVNYGTIYFYKAMAVDTTGNASAFTGTASGTPVQVFAGDIAGGQVTTPAIGTNAVSSVSSAFSTGFQQISALSGEFSLNGMSLVKSTTGGPLLIIFSTAMFIQNQSAEVAAGAVTVYLRRNGAMLMNGIAKLALAPGGSFGNDGAVMVPITYVDTPGIGTFTYAISFVGSTDNVAVAGDILLTAGDRSLQITELKR